MTSASAGVLWWLARRELGIGPGLAALFVAVPIVTDRTMFYFSGASSEPWMLLGWAVALVLVRRLTRAAVAAEPGTALGIALGLTLAATALARTQGMAIAAAILIGLALSRVGPRRWLIATVADRGTAASSWTRLARRNDGAQARCRRYRISAATSRGSR